MCSSPARSSGCGVTGLEVHVVDGTLAVAVDEIDERTADADDGRDVELHGPDAAAMRLGAERNGALEGRGRVVHAERHGAHRRPVRLRELLAEGIRLGVDDEVDVALRMQRHVLGAVAGDHREPQALEQAAQQLRDRARRIRRTRTRRCPWDLSRKESAITGLRREIDLVSIVTIPPECERRKQPMTRREKLHLEGFLPYRLSVLSNTVSSAIAAAYFANFGLSIPEWRVMAVLAANPGLSAAEVTARTAMDKVAVSRAVATLLVRRPPAAHHGAGGPPPHAPRAHRAPARASTRRSCPWR